MVHGPSCTACGIFPDQGSDSGLLHWQVNSWPLSHQGSPKLLPFDMEENYHSLDSLHVNLLQIFGCISNPTNVWTILKSYENKTLVLLTTDLISYTNHYQHINICSSQVLFHLKKKKSATKWHWSLISFRNISNSLYKLTTGFPHWTSKHQKIFKIFIGSQKCGSDTSHQTPNHILLVQHTLFLMFLL